MDFKTIDKSNYRECMELQVEESQKHFVADNTRSLVEAAYEDGLYALGVYDGDTMVGFVLYDYDDTYPGWSMSRFMIGRQFQGKGYGKALIDFVAAKYKGKYSILQVGTGDSPLTVPFYEKSGFVRSHSIKNFFIDNYDHPIFEGGVQLTDMIYLQKKI